MESLMVECVQSSLRLFMNRNAIFLCERLCAEFPDELNLQLLASCYLRNSQAYCAYHILKGAQMAQSRYLFAISCLQMDLFNEAEAALLPTNDPNGEVPNGAAGHYLLGLIYRYTDRRKNAVSHFMQALALDPFLWAAYEELCVLGAAKGADLVFGEEAAHLIHQQHSHSGRQECNGQFARTSVEASSRQLKQSLGNSLKEIPPAYPIGVNMGSGFCTQPANCPSQSLYATPSPVSTQITGVIPSPPCRIVLPNLGVMGGEVSPKSTVNPVLQAPRRKFLDEGKLRKSLRSSSARAANNQISGRLFADSAPRRSARLTGDATANANSNIVHVGGNGIYHSSSKLLGGFSSSAKICSATLRSVTLRKGQNGVAEILDEVCKGPNRVAEILDEGRLSEASDDLHLGKTSSTSVMMALTDDRLIESNRADVQMGGALTSGSLVPRGVTELLCLLKTLGEAYRLFCLYKCQDALEAFNKLPHQQFNTGWVLSQVGKAYFEMVDLFEADRTFDLARHASPYSLEGMDIYSTVLYHLKEELKLRYLAQELIATDRLSPQAWCAMGNCYSLLKDHETALKSFQRAVQLDSKFAYAHTLCGHEYVVLEDFENGIKSYQCALRVDPRHYNAWYGLGMVYLRQEKYEFAEHHFRKAFLINKHSSVLMCYLGIALHSLKRDEEALEIMEKAILADKKNPLPMYQKGNILLSMERTGEALRVLEQLKESVPRESSVFALMGKIYKRLGMHDKAMFHFGVALDLKPSAADVATIKSAIEKLNVPDELVEM